MDPLTLSMAIVKALSIALRLGLDLNSLVGDYQNAPQSLRAATFLVKEMGLVLSSMHSLLNNLVALHPSRKSMIELDHLVVVVTQTTITFLDLEEAVHPFRQTKAGGSWDWTKLRVEWLRKEKGIQGIMDMMSQHKSSLSMIMDILQCKSDQEAQQSHQKLISMMQAVLDQNEDMRDRLARLEANGLIKPASIRFFERNEDDDDDNVTIRPGPSNWQRAGEIAAITRPISIFENVPAEFELILGDSRVYRRVEMNACDMSFRSSLALTHAWSIFSGLSLSEISAISVISLPLRESELQRLHEIPDGTESAEMYSSFTDDVNSRIDTNLSYLTVLTPEFSDKPLWSISSLLHPNTPPVTLTPPLASKSESTIAPDLPVDSLDQPPATGDEPAQAALISDSLHSSGTKSTAPHVKREAVPPSQDQIIERLRTKIADARQKTEHIASSSKGTNNVFRLNLTIDLGHLNMTTVPEAVVELIKENVKRLSLSNNGIRDIPARISECSHLRYLNLRKNILREIPQAVYLMPFLEILDVSRNNIGTISPQIARLTSMRILAMEGNQVINLPTELCDMTRLAILKVAGNPLELNLRRAIQATELECTRSERTENEAGILVTAQIKRFLRALREWGYEAVYLPHPFT
ncbi:uncharacterized protein PV07_03765 [Cladophialophora immunda]|uniref:Uncharacterized protein n=1 Tax=Cladophialophora immunda TaxID=569365 RepID=A0A0D2CQG2_9EURO|nr:uncharacterized protein PV07_03765 [Cladophialophora immunda]KIW32205.1 hypothetical protein PV07_03765 [Cladophialophora immunda]OQV03624.1 Leucine Rich repeat-containing protein [Cladophialophora immunda]